MQRLPLVLVALSLAACAPEIDAVPAVHTQEPGVVADHYSDVTPPEPRGVDTPELPPTTGEPPLPWMFVNGTFVDTEGRRLSAAEACTADLCVPVIDGYGTLPLPMQSDMEIRVRASGSAIETVTPLHTGTAGTTGATFTVYTEDDVAALHEAFGVLPKEGTAILVQSVLGLPDDIPSLDGDTVVGPFFLDLDGRPMPKATRPARGGGQVLFFGIEPGTHTLELPGCDEGATHWGRPSDGGIEFAAEASDVIRLLPTTCV